MQLRFLDRVTLDTANTAVVAEFVDEIAGETGCTNDYQLSTTFDVMKYNNVLYLALGKKMIQSESQSLVDTNGTLIAKIKIQDIVLSFS